MRAQQPLQVAGLRVGEGAPRSQGPSRPRMGEGVQTALGISGPPVADRFATDAQEVSHLGLREPQLTAMQGTQAQGFQDFVGEFPSIGQRDGHETFLERANGKWHHGISGQLSCRGNITPGTTATG